MNAVVTMPVGTYTGQIVLTSRDGTQTLTVPVTLTVADPAAGPLFDNLPGQMSFSMQTGGTAPPSQPVQIRNAGSGTLNWTLETSTSDGGNWLNVSSANGTAPSAVNVSITKQNLPGQGLIPGIFVGELVFRTRQPKHHRSGERHRGGRRFPAGERDQLRQACWRPAPTRFLRR